MWPEPPKSLAIAAAIGAGCWLVWLGLAGEPSAIAPHPIEATWSVTLAPSPLMRDTAPAPRGGSPCCGERTNPPFVPIERVTGLVRVHCAVRSRTPFCQPTPEAMRLGP